MVQRPTATTVEFIGLLISNGLILTHEISYSNVVDLRLKKTFF